MSRSLTSTLQLLQSLDRAAARGAPRDELDALFDELIAAQAALAEPQRKRVRAAYLACETWSSWGYWSEHEHHGRRFARTGEIADLRRALADYSLKDGYPDPRDAVVGFSQLSADATRHGVDAGPVFREIAELTSPDDPASPATFIGSLRSYLMPLAAAHRTTRRGRRRRR